MVSEDTPLRAVRAGNDHAGTSTEGERGCRAACALRCRELQFLLLGEDAEVSAPACYDEQHREPYLCGADNGRADNRRAHSCRTRDCATRYLAAGDASTGDESAADQSAGYQSAGHQSAADERSAEWRNGVVQGRLILLRGAPPRGLLASRWCRGLLQLTCVVPFVRKPHCQHPCVLRGMLR